jgi:hypothetical protein
MRTSPFVIDIAAPPHQGRPPRGNRRRWRALAGGAVLVLVCAGCLGWLIAGQLETQ